MLSREHCGLAARVVCHSVCNSLIHLSLTMADIGMVGGISQYDDDNDAYMLPPISQQDVNGDSASEMPMTWHFGQVFGERSPGEEVLDGVLFIYLPSYGMYII